MNKLILSTLLAAGVVVAKEHCEFVGTNDYKYKFTTIYEFHCTGVNGYDYVEHEVFVKHKVDLSGVYTSYYIDGNKRKVETFDYTENEKKNGDVEIIGYKCVTLYDEFNIIMHQNESITSFDTMRITLLSKWNKLKRYIKKEQLDK